jgi:signal transduction histidine kinase
MFIQIALILSVLLQFGAFFITVSLIPKTRLKISWVTISIGFLLMAFRRFSELIAILNHIPSDDQTLFNSWLAVLISLLMFIASFYIRRIFNLQDRISKLRKENEAKVLSAIIKTEEKERQFFAKELHDGLGPIISSIKMALSAINKTSIGSSNEIIIEKSEQAVDNAIITIKEISNNLSPHILERFGLEKAIKTFIDNCMADKSLAIQITSNLEGRRYDYNIEVVVYRIICELVTNTLKHASATLVEVSLLHYTNKLEVFYTDNGIGFKIEDSENKGMGLSNIQSRIKSLDGEMEIHTKPNKGLFLKITIPV